MASQHLHSRVVGIYSDLFHLKRCESCERSHFRRFVTDLPMLIYIIYLNLMFSLSVYASPLLRPSPSWDFEPFPGTPLREDTRHWVVTALLITRLPRALESRNYNSVNFTVKLIKGGWKREICRSKTLSSSFCEVTLPNRLEYNPGALGIPGVCLTTKPWS